MVSENWDNWEWIESWRSYGMKGERGIDGGGKGDRRKEERMKD